MNENMNGAWRQLFSLLDLASDQSMLSRAIEDAMESEVVPIEDIDQYLSMRFEESYISSDYKESEKWLFLAQAVRQRMIEMDVTDQLTHEDREFFAFNLPLEVILGSSELNF